MKRIFMILLIVCFSFLLLAKDDEKPSWVDNPKSLYPDGLYLSAVGQGDTRTDAENLAAANISRIFETKVKVNNTLKEEYKEVIKNKETSSEAILDSQKDISLDSKQTLFNIQFGESYTDNLGRVYAVAYIDRMKTSDIYEKRISDNSTQIFKLLEEEKRADNLIAKYSFLRASVVFADLNEVLLKQLQIISPNTVDFAEIDYDIIKIKKALKETAEKISFNIKISGEKNDEIAQLLKNVLTEKGFTIVENNSAMLYAEGKISFEKVNLNRPRIKSIRWILHLDVYDKANNEILSYLKKGRATKTTAERAKHKAILEIKDVIRRNFYPELKKKFILR